MARWTLSGLLRGGEEALKGMKLVLRNPNLRKQKFLRIFAYLCGVSILLFCITKILVTVPMVLLRLVLWLWWSEEPERADAALETASSFIHDSVSFIPLLALLFIRYLYAKPLDDLFMESLRYIDTCRPETPSYAEAMAARHFRREYWANLKSYLQRTGKKLRLGLLLYVVSFLPYVGRFVFPAAGVYTTWRSLGNTQGIAVGVCFCFLPSWAILRLVRALVGMRALMRELLEPYFTRMNMSHKEKRQWFSSRKDVLFGFSAIAYCITRLPYVGFMGYGIAQAAAAYMLTVVAEPPPQQSNKQD
ncbi:hypothetical protein BDF14DRAFT_1875877 [Spinellus fusiger]|nr:hypothetical protein BDF14DRAFT_1875877 [Spinellus fusiger]